MDQIIGYLLGDDEAILRELSLGCNLVIDLGTCSGRSAIILAEKAKSVITIDVFEKLDLIRNEGSRAHYKELFEKNPHNFADVKLSLSCYPNIVVVNDLAHAFASTQEDNSVDLIFIDADHSFTGVQRDYNAWFPKVRRDGLFAFHDATNENWDVKEFCDLLMLMDGSSHINGESDYSVVEEIAGAGSIRVFRKL